MSNPRPTPEAVQRAFAAEEERGLDLASRGRMVAAVFIGGWVWLDNEGWAHEGVWYFLGIVALLGVSEMVAVALVRRGLGSWPLYLQPVVDMNLLALAVFLPNPLEPDQYPVPMNLRFSDDTFLFLLLAGYTLGYAPRRIVWSGFVAVASWSLWILWVASLPGTRAELEIPGFDDLPMAGQLAMLLDPQRVVVGVWLKEVVILSITTVILAVVVARSRRLVLRHAAAERERSNLSRYFSPRLVDRIARTEDPNQLMGQRTVAVLFADLAGFTTLASKEAPERVILLLREYHRRMAEAVFAHDGTLDEYLGDGVMATFGAMTEDLPDASNALRCAREIQQQIADWSRSLEAAGGVALHCRVGIHFGPVVLGNVGDQQLKFAVVGDTVNTASRLQELAKELEARIVVSDALRVAARGEGVALELVERLSGPERREVRGRTDSVEVWYER